MLDQGDSAAAWSSGALRKRGKGSNARFLLSWLSIFLLFFNVVAAGAMPGERTGAVLADASRAYVSPSCHGAAKMVGAHRKDRGAPDAPAPHHGDDEESGGKVFCALCLPLMQGASMLPAPLAPSLLALSFPPAPPLPNPSEAATPARPYTPSSPRAPPPLESGIS